MEKLKQIVCVLIGHSRIVEYCFGYVSCARCKQQIGDTLGGCYSLEDKVIVGHNCATCRENYGKLRWRDKLLCPDPFEEAR